MCDFALSGLTAPATGYGTTELGYGATNADAGVGIGLKGGKGN